MNDPKDGSCDWLTVAEVASALHVSRMTIYREISANRFPALRIGRRILVPARVLDQLADTALATGTSVSPEALGQDSST
ncbi:helix-turn-helix domain-containing protein [Kribbella speibonae]|uniref:DNA-binding protein n=1 Tax=Kribbella speibonae TaxID=1572660 RepID=A0A4R0ITJ4_9ACTN|nr:helix-turn-helix domain-containing protein [Kribbella speibonae]TCC32035.1 DNA-binding protein [Kribbella speibonae]